MKSKLIKAVLWPIALLYFVLLPIKSTHALTLTNNSILNVDDLGNALTRIQNVLPKYDYSKINSSGYFGLITQYAANQIKEAAPTTPAKVEENSGVISSTLKKYLSVFVKETPASSEPTTEESPASEGRIIDRISSLRSVYIDGINTSKSPVSFQALEQDTKTSPQKEEQDVNQDTQVSQNDTSTQTDTTVYRPVCEEWGITTHAATTVKGVYAKASPISPTKAKVTFGSLTVDMDNGQKVDFTKEGYSLRSLGYYGDWGADTIIVRTDVCPLKTENTKDDNQDKKETDAQTPAPCNITLKKEGSYNYNGHVVVLSNHSGPYAGLTIDGELKFFEVGDTVHFSKSKLNVKYLESIASKFSGKFSFCEADPGGIAAVKVGGADDYRTLFVNACSGLTEGTKTIDVVSDNGAIIKETGSGSELAWKHDFWTEIPGAYWIWKKYFVEDPAISKSYTFNTVFDIADKKVIGAKLTIGADDEFTAWINDKQIGEALRPVVSSNSPKSYTIAPDALKEGINNLTVKATNVKPSQPPAVPQLNPAGVVYKLSVTIDCSIPKDEDDTKDDEKKDEEEKYEPGQCIEWKETKYKAERTKPGLSRTTYWEDTFITKGNAEYASHWGDEDVEYRIVWWDNSLSKWYQFGINDLDAKFNTTNGLQKHVYAYFQDHYYWLRTCIKRAE